MNSLVVATLGLKRAMRKVDGVDVSDFFFGGSKSFLQDGGADSTTPFSCPLSRALVFESRPTYASTSLATS